MPKGIKGSKRTFQCLFCGKENYWKYQGNISNKFCNLDCNQSYKVLEKMNVECPTKSTAYTYMKRFVEYRCNECGITEHNGKPITLQVDHISGNNKDHRKENLRWLCPNCHSQTETWGVKNVSDDGRIRMNEGGRKGRLSQISK